MSYSNDTNILELLTDQSVLDKPIIRPLRHLAELQEVYRLTHNCYAESGYSKTHPSGFLVHYPYFDHIPETTILVAYVQGKMVGSVSYTLDGPSGLTVDEDFREECDALRFNGKKIATVWRLVVEESFRSQRSIVMNLIDELIERIISDGTADTCLFSVNPKHENVYKRMLNMEVIGRKDVTDGLSDAPAVLLRGETYKIVQKRHGVDTYNPIHTLLAVSNY